MEKVSRLKDYVKSNTQLNEILTNLVAQHEKGLIAEHDILHTIDNIEQNTRLMKALLKGGE